MSDLDEARKYFHLTDQDMKRLDRKVIEDWIKRNELNLLRPFYKDLLEKWKEENKHLKVLLEKGF